MALVDKKYANKDIYVKLSTVEILLFGCAITLLWHKIGNVLQKSTQNVIYMTFSYYKGMHKWKHYFMIYLTNQCVNAYISLWAICVSSSFVHFISVHPLYTSLVITNLIAQVDKLTMYHIIQNSGGENWRIRIMKFKASKILANVEQLNVL